ncbi:TIGR04283 family arsenosugar biosynthesis glycosyltransferase [Porticoccus sp. W117]|uniref:TIGR04283 family arsenosugar biosynthesis glycosyltransferase n=1 Tax=Porticoccus sp. W117 TaxID=3054777 RepID=UPI0025936790|nr:TIGR04283 family arsenosugar biosynthesis glycosyltransferase [Porticoccus sp. W117]MDM3871109.1 TIGR04283 family arsenosugar biosynthesis glycosyltransferase [Porticoccus sp. W117]
MISVIVPTLNEERALPATLEALLSQQGSTEVIICDGGSTDNTVAIAHRYMDRLPLDVMAAPKGRASQMNAAARKARGEWLLFLHADTILPVDALTAIKNCSDDAGVFHHRFSGSHWGLKLISLLHNSRFRKTGIMYGDQGIFVRRKLFQRLGGYPDELMEDIRFSEKLLEHTQPVQLAQTLVTDSRKFEQIGVWRAFWWVLVILWRDRVGRIARLEFFAEYR